MSKMKELFQQKQKESKALGGFYDPSDILVTNLELSFPSLREMIHQASDHGELDKVIDMVFAFETEVQV